jgi:hypothetical protein
LGARRPLKKTAFVPRAVFRVAVTGSSVIPVCVAAGLSSLGIACVAESAFYCNDIELEGGDFVLKRDCVRDASTDERFFQDVAAFDAGFDATDSEGGLFDAMEGGVDAHEGGLSDGPFDAPDGSPSDGPVDARDGGLPEGSSDAPDGTHG